MKRDNVFNPEKKTNLNQISLTGLRALVLIGLLINKPRSLEEIRQAFIDFKIIDEKSSNDILRIDLNTIKLMGCKILRPSIKNDYKYILTEQPFSLKLTKDELRVLKKVYKKLKKESDLNILIDYDELFKNIASYISDEELKQEFLGISVLKYYDIGKIKELIVDCKKQNTLELLYAKPTSKNVEKREVVTQKLELRNDKLYLFCYDVEKKESRMFNVQRIKEILVRKLKKNDIEIKRTKIKFIIKYIGKEELQENERIIDKLSEGFLVEAEYFNDFIAIQRILSFGPNCIILEPQEIKNKIIEKIKDMKKTYGC